MEESISVNTVKIQNRAAVFRALLVADELTRNELARQCGVSLGTVATILEELGKQGVITETKAPRTSIGRKPNIVRIIGSAKRILAIDLASRNFVYEIMDIDLENSSRGTYQFSQTHSFEENLRRMLLEIWKHIHDTGIPDESIIGIGVSVPGSYRYSVDRIDNSPFPELHSIGLQRLIQEFFPQPIMIEHDVFLAARAEVQRLPEYRNRNMFYLFLGEGVGGALAIEGKVYKGAREDAGDIGRVLVNDQETLEEMVSWTITEKILGLGRIERDYRYDESIESLLQDPKSQLWVRLNEVAENLALALHNAFWILDPHSFVIGGEYHRFGLTFINMVREHLDSCLGREIAENVEVKLSRHGSRGARIGASEIVREAWLSSL